MKGNHLNPSNLHPIGFKSLNVLQRESKRQGSSTSHDSYGGVDGNSPKYTKIKKTPLKNIVGKLPYAYRLGNKARDFCMPVSVDSQSGRYSSHQRFSTPFMANDKESRSCTRVQRQITQDMNFFKNRYKTPLGNVYADQVEESDGPSERRGTSQVLVMTEKDVIEWHAKSMKINLHNIPKPRPHNVSEKMYQLFQKYQTTPKQTKKGVKMKKFSYDQDDMKYHRKLSNITRKQAKVSLARSSTIQDRNKASTQMGQSQNDYYTHDPSIQQIKQGSMSLLQQIREENSKKKELAQSQKQHSLNKALEHIKRSESSDTHVNRHARDWMKTSSTFSRDNSLIREQARIQQEKSSKIIAELDKTRLKSKNKIQKSTTQKSKLAYFPSAYPSKSQHTNSQRSPQKQVPTTKTQFVKQTERAQLIKKYAAIERCNKTRKEYLFNPYCQSLNAKQLSPWKNYKKKSFVNKIIERQANHNESIQKPIDQPISALDLQYNQKSEMEIQENTSPTTSVQQTFRTFGDQQPSIQVYKRPSIDPYEDQSQRDLKSITTAKPTQITQAGTDENYSQAPFPHSVGHNRSTKTGEAQFISFTTGEPTGVNTQQQTNRINQLESSSLLMHNVQQTLPEVSMADMMQPHKNTQFQVKYDLNLPTHFSQVLVQTYNKKVRELEEQEREERGAYADSPRKQKVDKLLAVNNSAKQLHPGELDQHKTPINHTLSIQEEGQDKLSLPAIDSKLTQDESQELGNESLHDTSRISADQDKPIIPAISSLFLSKSKEPEGPKISCLQSTNKLNDWELKTIMDEAAVPVQSAGVLIKVYMANFTSDIYTIDRDAGGPVLSGKYFIEGDGWRYDKIEEAIFDLAKVSFFCRFSPLQLRDFIGRLKVQTYEFIHEQDQWQGEFIVLDADEVAVIISGHVLQVDYTNCKGKPKIVAQLNPGHIIGMNELDSYIVPQGGQNIKIDRQTLLIPYQRAELAIFKKDEFTTIWNLQKIEARELIVNTLNQNDITKILTVQSIYKLAYELMEIRKFNQGTSIMHQSKHSPLNMIALKLQIDHDSNPAHNNTIIITKQRKQKKYDDMLEYLGIDTYGIHHSATGNMKKYNKKLHEENLKKTAAVNNIKQLFNLIQRQEVKQKERFDDELYQKIFNDKQQKMIDDQMVLSRNMPGSVNRKGLTDTAEFSQFKTSNSDKLKFSQLYDESDKHFLQQQSFKFKKKSNQYMQPIHTKQDSVLISHGARKQSVETQESRADSNHRFVRRTKQILQKPNLKGAEIKENFKEIMEPIVDYSQNFLKQFQTHEQQKHGIHILEMGSCKVFNPLSPQDLVSQNQRNTTVTFQQNIKFLNKGDFFGENDIFSTIGYSYFGNIEVASEEVYTLYIPSHALCHLHYYELHNMKQVCEHRHEITKLLSAKSMEKNYPYVENNQKPMLQRMGQKL